MIGRHWVWFFSLSWAAITRQHGGFPCLHRPSVPALPAAPDPRLSPALGFYFYFFPPSPSLGSVPALAGAPPAHPSRLSGSLRRFELKYPGGFSSPASFGEEKPGEAGAGRSLILLEGNPNREQTRSRARPAGLRRLPGAGGWIGAGEGLGMDGGSPAAGGKREERKSCTYLGTSGPDTGSGVLARGRRWRGLSAARRRAGAWSARRAAGGRPGRGEGARDGPARPGSADARRPLQRPSPGWSRPPCRWSGSR